jgi:DNA-binding GntR family transcriptional regulator
MSKGSKTKSSNGGGSPADEEPMSLPATTFERLKQDIILGVLPPGAALIEQQLAERYSVSRTPVRESLRRLEHDGLVERIDGTMQVRRRSPEEIFEHYEVRIVLECAAVKMAAQRRTDFDIAKLTSLLTAGDQDLAVVDRIRLDRLFHAAFWRASHNNTLVEMLERLYTHNVRFLNTTLASDERWEQSRSHHRQIVDAILSGDEQEAERLVAIHVRGARDIHTNEILSFGATSR